MNVPASTRFLLVAEVEGAPVKGIVVLNWEGTHVLPDFSSAQRALEFADPNSGGVPQGPGVTWRSVEFSPGEILYLLNQSEVRIDAVLKDPIPVPMDYEMAPLHTFVARLEIESKQTTQPMEGYGFFVR